MISFDIRRSAMIAVLGFLAVPTAHALSANYRYDGFFRAIRRGEMHEFLRRYKYVPDVLIAEQ